MKIIEIKNCDVYLESKKVLNNFSLMVNEGQHLAIIGPNGSGKSTLIRLLMRDLYPAFNKTNKAEVKILGQDSHNIFELRHEIALISIKFADELLTASPLTIFDAVASAFTASYGFNFDQKITQKQVDETNETLKKLDLFAIKNQMIHELSTGQLRRVLIARAMVLRPKIILLDEPTAGLDISASYKFMQFLQKILYETTIILVTHHLEEIMPEINNVLLLKEGEIFKNGNKKIVLNSQNMSELFAENIEINVSKDDIYSMRRI